MNSQIVWRNFAEYCRARAYFDNNFRIALRKVKLMKDDSLFSMIFSVIPAVLGIGVTLWFFIKIWPLIMLGLSLLKALLSL